MTFLASCASALPAPVPVCTQPAGTSAMFSTAPGPIDAYGFALTLSAPEACGGAVIYRLAGHGHRRFDQPQATTSCEGRPEGQNPCDAVSLVAFRSDVNAQLAKAGFAHGAGLAFTHQCRAREPDGSIRVRLLVHLMDWSQADAALHVLIDRVRAWRIGDTVELMVGSQDCGGEAL